MRGIQNCAEVKASNTPSQGFGGNEGGREQPFSPAVMKSAKAKPRFAMASGQAEVLLAAATLPGGAEERKLKEAEGR